MLKKVKQNPPAKVGMKVKAINPDTGAEIIGEVVEISNQVRNLITKIKTESKDGTELVEVSGWVVDAVKIVTNVGKTNVFKAFWSWFSGLFKKKNK
jgi:hypothetical protein